MLLERNWLTKSTRTRKHPHFLVLVSYTPSVGTLPSIFDFKDSRRARHPATPLHRWSLARIIHTTGPSMLRTRRLPHFLPSKKCLGTSYPSCVSQRIIPARWMSRRHSQTSTRKPTFSIRFFRVAWLCKNLSMTYWDSHNAIIMLSFGPSSFSSAQKSATRGWKYLRILLSCSSPRRSSSRLRPLNSTW